MKVLSSPEYLLLPHLPRHGVRGRHEGQLRHLGHRLPEAPQLLPETLAALLVAVQAQDLQLPGHRRHSLLLAGSPPSPFTSLLAFPTLASLLSLTYTPLQDEAR